MAKLQLASGTWKSNLVYVIIGLVLITASNLIGGIIGGGLDILGLILLFSGLLHLIVLFFRHFFKK